MRYNNVPTITFTDIDGESFNVKDIRPITEYSQGINIDYQQGAVLSELITRPEYYGKNTEDLTYAVVDANIEALVENDFDFTKIRTLFLPVIGSV